MDVGRGNDLGKALSIFCVCLVLCYFLKLKLGSRCQVNSNLAKRVMMRKQPFWVGAQEFCSMTTPLAPRVWPFSKDLSLGSPLQFPLCFPQDTFRSNNLELSPLKISDHCARCLLPSSLFPAHFWPGIEDCPSSSSLLPCSGIYM